MSLTSWVTVCFSLTPAWTGGQSVPGWSTPDTAAAQLFSMEKSTYLVRLQDSTTVFLSIYSVWERMEADDVCVFSSGGIGCDGEDRGQSRRCLSSVEIYNPDTDTWRPGPTLPTSLLSLRTNATNIGVVEGKLYLCGYYKGAGQSLNTCQRFLLTACVVWSFRKCLSNNFNIWLKWYTIWVCITVREC